MSGPSITQPDTPHGDGDHLNDQIIHQMASSTLQTGQTGEPSIKLNFLSQAETSSQKPLNVTLSIVDSSYDEPSSPSHIVSPQPEEIDARNPSMGSAYLQTEDHDVLDGQSGTSLKSSEELKQNLPETGLRAAPVKDPLDSKGAYFVLGASLNGVSEATRVKVRSQLDFSRTERSQLDFSSTETLSRNGHYSCTSLRRTEICMLLTFRSRL
jgi:hypothetical protein